MEIVTHRVSRRFGAHRALSDVSFTARGPGLVGLLGPNGAGKTTWMRLVTGAVSATAGALTVLGVDVALEPERARSQVGYLPEQPPLIDELLVGEYLELAARLHHLAGAPMHRRIGVVLEQTGLVGWERRRIASLSKGYRQRVGLAQALVHDPPVLLLDEPMSGLDPVQLEGLRELITSAARTRLVLLATHRLSEVERLCDQMVLLDRGVVVGEGTLAQLLARTDHRPHYLVAVDGAADAVAGVLAAMPSVTRAEAMPDGWAVETDVDARALRSDLEARGVRVARLQRRAPGLEDVFRALVSA